MSIQFFVLTLFILAEHSSIRAAIGTPDASPGPSSATCVAGSDSERHRFTEGKTRRQGSDVPHWIAPPTPPTPPGDDGDEASADAAKGKRLMIGEKAPAVRIEQWIVNKPAALPQDKDAQKQVFLVAFWATWDPRCRKAMPELAKLHEKRAKDGLVIVAVSNEEEEIVKDFVAKQAGLPFAVGLDDEMATNLAWMEGVEEFPYAFLVDKSGVIVWNGNPIDLSGLEATLEKVLSGKFDLAAAKNAAAAARKYDELMQDLRAAYGAKNKEKVLKLLDEMIAGRPDELHPYMIKRQMLAEFEMHEALVEHDKRLEEHFRDSADAMMTLVEMELNQDLAHRDPLRMIRCARRAMTLSKDRDSAVLAAAARVMCELGLIDEAIDAQEKAVEVAAPDEADAQRKVLQYFKTAKRLVDSAPMKSAPK